MFVAVSLTVYVPADENVCVGFWDELVPLSPKSHDQAVGANTSYVDVSVNVTDKGAAPDVAEAVKLAVGGVGTHGSKSSTSGISIL